MDFTPLRILRNLGRTRQIASVLLNHGFNDVADRLGIVRTFERWRRWLFRRGGVPWRTMSRAERVRHVLEDLGFIPSFADWVRCIRAQPWMGRAQPIHKLVAPFAATEPSMPGEAP